MNSCIETLADEIQAMMIEHVPVSEIVNKFNHEDADLVGEAIVEAQARIADVGSPQ